MAWLERPVGDPAPRRRRVLLGGDDRGRQVPVVEERGVAGEALLAHQLLGVEAAVGLAELGVPFGGDPTRPARPGPVSTRATSPARTNATRRRCASRRPPARPRASMSRMTASDTATAGRGRPSTNSPARPAAGPRAHAGPTAATSTATATAAASAARARTAFARTPQRY